MPDVSPDPARPPLARPPCCQWSSGESLVSVVEPSPGAPAASSLCERSCSSTQLQQQSTQHRMRSGEAEAESLLAGYRRTAVSAPSTPSVGRRKMGEREQSFGDVSREEYVQTVATRVVYSRGYGAFYVSMLAASITEIVWILHPWTDPAHCCSLRYPDSPVFFVVESYLTLGLVGDTALRMKWQGREFWTQWGNKFDFGVSVLSICCFGVYMADIDQELEVVFLVLMIVWLGLRIARLAAVAKNLHSQRRTAAAGSLDVKFPGDDEEEGGVSPRPMGS